ncbi:MAG: TetR/AcrR family transcriptional regulator [Arenicella sp.]|nr:TetR/AcrR family transcriptional regulator [Arenicella sp.]
MNPSRKKDASSGRRRDSTKHQAILQATRELLDDKGYRALSLKSIASRSKVSRNVLYNWWNGDINSIVEESLLPDVSAWPMPDNGNFRQDIEQFLSLTIDAIHKPNVLKGILILASEVANDKNQLTQTSRYFRAPYARMVARIIKNAERRDEITKGLESKVIAQMLSGSVMQFAISKNPGRRKTKMVLCQFVMKIAAK